MNNKLTLAAVVAATGGHLRSSVQVALAQTTTPAIFPPSARSQSSYLDSALDSASPGSESTLTIEKVVYDSREVEPGSLFVALPGEVTDGHHFLSEAVKKGAVACLVRCEWADTQSSLDPAVAWIEVEETLAAFQRLVAFWRNQFTGLEVVGITGSVGKTSTKELLAAVLGQRFRVFKSPRSVNTEQSLLPILLNLSEADEVAVIEMGAGYAFGELERLCRVAKPRIGVELGVSHSHLGRMGSLENIARNKSELVRSLPDAAQGGVAVLNGDDVRVHAMYTLTQARPFFYGTRPNFDLWADEIESFGLDGIAFLAHYGQQTHRLRLPLLGRHSVHTALAVSAVALLLGLGWREIEAGLTERSAQVRLLVLPGQNGSTVIDDSYNASPVSTVAALDLLADIQPPAGGRRLAVLGDMLELGSFEEEGHRMVGRRAAGVVDELAVVGPLSQITGQEALTHGLRPEQVFFAQDKAALLEWLEGQGRLSQGDYLLVKASRGIGLEEIVQKVRATE